MDVWTRRSKGIHEEGKNCLGGRKEASARLPARLTDRERWSLLIGRCLGAGLPTEKQRQLKGGGRTTENRTPARASTHTHCNPGALWMACKQLDRSKSLLSAVLLVREPSADAASSFPGHGLLLLYTGEGGTW